MHNSTFGKTNGFTTQSFYPCPQCKVLALYSLSIIFANSMLFWCDISFVAAPVICVKPTYAQGFQNGFQLLENGIFPASESESQYHTGVVVDGQPKPTLVFLVLDKAPKFIKLCRLGFVPFFPEYDFHTDTAVYVMAIDIADVFCCFFNVFDTFDFDIFSTLDISRIPEAFAVISMMDASIPGLLPL